MNSATPPARRRRPLAAAGATLFIAAAVVQLALRLANADELTLRVSQALLMPALAVWALAPRPRTAARSPRVGVPIALAIAGSWAGDLAPGFFGGDTGFLVMVGAFFVAQLAWITTLWPWRRSSIAVGPRRPLLLAYAAAALTVLILCAPGAGPLLAAIVPYAVVLASTAVLATGLGLVGAVGGLLFMVSDAMIAIFSFTPTLDPGVPWRGLAVMATYSAAQGLLVLAVRGKERVPS